MSITTETFEMPAEGDQITIPGPTMGVQVRSMGWAGGRSLDSAPRLRRRSGSYDTPIKEGGEYPFAEEATPVIYNPPGGDASQGDIIRLSLYDSLHDSTVEEPQRLIGAELAGGNIPTIGGEDVTTPEGVEVDDSVPITVTQDGPVAVLPDGTTLPVSLPDSYLTGSDALRVAPEGRKVGLSSTHTDGAGRVDAVVTRNRSSLAREYDSETSEPDHMLVSEIGKSHQIYGSNIRVKNKSSSASRCYLDLDNKSAGYLSVVTFELGGNEVSHFRVKGSIPKDDRVELSFNSSKTANLHMRVKLVESSSNLLHVSPLEVEPIAMEEVEIPGSFK